MLGLGLGETVGDMLETLSHRLPMRERFFEAKVLEVVADDLLTKKRGGLLILFKEGVFVIGTEDLTAMIEPFQHVLPFARDSFEQSLRAKENGQAIGGQKVETQFAGALEDGADGPVAFKDEVAAILNLHAGVNAVQTGARRAFPGRKLRSDDQGPVVNALLQCLPIELVGGSLQGLGIPDGNKPIIVFGERNLFSAQLPLNEVVPIEIGRHLKGHEGTHAQDHRAGNLVQNVKIIMGITTLVFAQKLEVGVLGGVFGGNGSKGPALLHALEDVIDPKAVFPD